MNRHAGSQGLRLLAIEERVEAAEWRNFQLAPASERRVVLFNRFRHFAQRLAKSEWHRVPNLGLAIEDCEQLAYEALLHSIERFDPTRGTPFTAFARRRIRGAIQNALPKATEANAAHQARKRAERDRLTSLKRSATQTDREDPIDTLRELVVGMALGFMLEDASDDRVQQVPSEAPSAYDSAAWGQITHELERKLASLPERERMILDYHYKQGVRFTDIAALLGLSKGRISQIHAQALNRLRVSLSKFR